VRSHGIMVSGGGSGISTTVGGGGIGGGRPRLSPSFFISAEEVNSQKGSS